MAQSLCRRCQKFSISLTASSWTHDAGSVADVFNTSKTGCEFCLFLNTALDLEAQIGAQAYPAWATQRRVVVRKTIGKDVLELEPQPTSRTRTAELVTLRIDAQSSQTTDSYQQIASAQERLWQPIRSEADSPQSFDVAKTWLHDCLDKHQECKAATATTLPTRIIDVGSGHSDYVKIVIPDPSTVESYAALSYCWGNGSTLTATPEALPSLMNGFSLTSLSKTLQHAIKVTRELGLKYLWIDALCILQGPSTEARDDWTHESSMMGKIYSNAQVTISASCSSSSQYGLFYPRSIQMRAYSRTGFARIKRQEVVTLSIEGYPREYKDEPIHRRAWVLQERMLSRRILAYCLQDMMWHCRRGMTWERTSPGRTHRIHRETIQDIKRRRWDLVVYEYSSRSLTEPTDKLPALSAIAQSYNETTAGEYLAGLWRKDMPAALLWQRGDIGKIYLPALPLQFPTQYRAPSWSWASLDCNIWGLPCHNFVAEIVSCTTTLSTMNPYGAVSAGELVIETSFVESSIQWMSDSSSGSDGKSPSLFTIPTDGSMPESLAELWSDEDEHVHRPDTDRTSPVVAALICERPYRYGLALRRSLTSPQKYIRVGMFCSSNHSQVAFDTAKRLRFVII